jgi:hypothetical protein
MYGSVQDRELYEGQGLGVAPIAVAGAATGAIKKIGGLIGGLLGGGGPPYANAVDRVKDAYKYAMSGGTAPRKYKPSGTDPYAPVEYLGRIAAITAQGSQYKEARQAALTAVQNIAASGPEPNKSAAAALLAGSAPSQPYPATSVPTPSLPSSGQVGTVALVGGAALLAIMILRRRR